MVYLRDSPNRNYIMYKVDYIKEPVGFSSNSLLEYIMYGMDIDYSMVLKKVICSQENLLHSYLQ